jgi:hypothetical protein
MTVREAAELVAERAAARGLRGLVIPAEDMRKVVEALVGAYPAWLANLLTTVPLCGLELGWQEFEPEPDYDGRSWLRATSMSHPATWAREIPFSSTLGTALTRRFTGCITISVSRPSRFYVVGASW